MFRKRPVPFFGAASVVVLQKLYSLEELDSEQIEKDVPQMIETSPAHCFVQY
jgi:hypothetical protein